MPLAAIRHRGCKEVARTESRAAEASRATILVAHSQTENTYSSMAVPRNLRTRMFVTVYLCASCSVGGGDGGCIIRLQQSRKGTLFSGAVQIRD